MALRAIVSRCLGGQTPDFEKPKVGSQGRTRETILKNKGLMVGAVGATSRQSINADYA